MATIDINTETGEVKLPMRRVTGLEEIRVRAWIELITILGEWPTNTESGLDYQAIFDGADDEDIEDDVQTRLATIPNVQQVDVSISRTVVDGLNQITITAAATALNEIITVSVGTEV